METWPKLTSGVPEGNARLAFGADGAQMAVSDHAFAIVSTFLSSLSLHLQYYWRTVESLSGTHTHLPVDGFC